MPRASERTSRRSPKEAARKTKKKPCMLCRDKVRWVDYKDVGLLRRFMSDRGKIRARRVTGNCTQHQREIANAIKTAREVMLLPYTQRTMTERSGGRSRTRVERSDSGAGAARAGADGAAETPTATGVDLEPEDAEEAEVSGEDADELGEIDVDETAVSGNGAGTEAAAESPDDSAASNGSGGRDVAGDGA